MYYGQKKKKKRHIWCCLPRAFNTKSPDDIVLIVLNDPASRSACFPFLLSAVKSHSSIITTWTE